MLTIHHRIVIKSISKVGDIVKAQFEYRVMCESARDNMMEDVSPQEV